MDNVVQYDEQPPQAVPPNGPHPTFDLPVELRMAVYHYLLKIQPDRSNILYDDLHHHNQFPPRNHHLGLYPTVLRVSRRTYADAVRVLYGENKFKICLFGEPEYFGEEEPLDYCLNPVNLLRQTSGSTLGIPLGLISPSALFSLRHLELDFNYEAFWGHPSLHPYPTKTSKLITDLLDILGSGPRVTDPVIFDKKRKLEVTIWSTVEGRCLSHIPPGKNHATRYPREFSSYVQELVFLLDDLRHDTELTVFQNVAWASTLDGDILYAPIQIEPENLVEPK